MTKSIFHSGHALLIGVGGDLPNTIDDAKGLGRILTDPNRCVYPEEQVAILTGEKATRSGILEAMKALIANTDEKSTIVVFFSGHGYRLESADGYDYFLMPYGYDTQRLSETAIEGKEFTELLRRLKTKKLLLLLDCCHAGGIADTKGVPVTKTPLPVDLPALLEKGQGRVVISSSKEDELSKAGKPYSAFTRALVESLCGMGVAKNDGFVRVADLAMHAREFVPKRTKGSQHPILHFEHADNFPLAYYAGGGHKPKALPFKSDPEIEPEPGAWQFGIDHGGQVVGRSQTDIHGDARGTILSGQFSGVINIDSTVQQARSLHQLPSAPIDFTGRENEIKGLLKSVSIGATITGVRGIGGIGKTAFALKMAEHLIEDYPDAQFFIDLQGSQIVPKEPIEAMSQVIRAYFPAIKLPKGEAEIKALYLSVLHGKRAIILLDDARNATQVSPLISPSTCCVLITSRQHFTLPGLLSCDLRVLLKDDAKSLLLKIAPRIGDSVEELAKLCSCLPLALRLAGSAIAERKTLRVDDYIALLKDAKKRVELIEASLNLSFNLLSDLLKKRWPMLTVFPADFERNAASAVWDIDSVEAESFLDELVRSSMVEYDENSERFKLHDIVREYAKTKLLEKSRLVIQSRHAKYYQKVLDYCDRLFEQGDDNLLHGLALYGQEKHNILAGELYESEICKLSDLPESVEQDNLKNPDVNIAPNSIENSNQKKINEEAYKLYHEGKKYYEMSGYEQLEIAERKFRGALKINPEFALAHAGLSDVHSFLYMAYYDRSKERIQLAKEEALLAIKYSPMLPEAYRSLSRYYLFTEDIPSAEHELLKSIKCNPKFMAAYRSMAWIKELQNDHVKAKEWARLALQQAPTDLETLLLLSLINMDQRKYTLAMTTLQRAIELAPDYGRAYYNLGTVYMKLGVMDLALQNFNLASKFKGDPNCFISSGYIYMVQGEIDKARKRFSQSVELGYLEFIAYYYRAFLEQHYGNKDEAEKYYRLSISWGEEYDKQNPGNIHIKVYKALALAGLDEYEKAIDLVEQTVTLADAEGEVLYNIARVYAIAKHMAKAKVILDLSTQRHAGPTEKEISIDPHFGMLSA